MLGALQQMSREPVGANPQAFFLLDHNGCVVRTNGAADALIESDDGLVASPQGLALRNPAEDNALQALIRRALIAMKSPAVEAMRALRPSGKRPYAILVSPLARETCVPATAAQPAVCVTIIDPDAPPRLSAAVLRALYDLTPAEARLAEQLAAGEDLKTAANRLGIGYGTVRAQLAAIFRKTETRRQAELVRLLCTLPHRPF